jgi:hypothetical protein
MKRFLILTIGLILGFNCFTQKIIDNHQNSWWNVSSTVKLNDKFSVSGLYSWRRYDFVNTWQQSLARIGFNYKIKNNFTITPGYDWVITYPYNGGYDFTEHRIYQQFTVKNKIGRINVKHRYRLEQRFLENIKLDDNNNYVSDGSRFRQRTRYRITLTIPLNHSEMNEHTLFLSVFNEIFINFGKGAGKKPLDQNWFNASLGWKFNSNTSLKIGYQNQYFIKGNGYDVEQNHILSIGFNHNFNLSK